jgi:pimeloyl-ACP methyl ester carboxylesterase
MAASGTAELRAAQRGRAALEASLASSVFDPEIFTSADEAALSGTWSWLADVAAQAIEAGLGGMVDDDLAYVAPWGFEPGQVTAPTLLLHGEQDRIVPSAHGEWLARHLPSAQLRLFGEDGHISVLYHSPPVMDWLRQHGQS